ncbi:MAG: hypothetical protein EXR77_11180 [Myxococcales bacterium]|nr:hypothetical protein [Myxococcales bacterium]
MVKRWIATVTALVALGLGLGLSARAAQADDEKARDDRLFDDDSVEDASAKRAKAATGIAKDATATTTAGDGADPAAADLGDERLTSDAKENTELLTRDRTQIGGMFYMRTNGVLAHDQKLSDIALGNSTLFEAYFDSRIHDRVRAYSRARVVYNPLADAQPAGPTLAGATFAQNTDEVRAILTQMWLKFDIGRTVFVTAGRQFVRFGATRFWNPVDVINVARFNPLTFFDDRVGPMMIKLHVPVESKNWNFYAIVLAENAIKAEQVGGLLRGEFLFGQTEIGVVGAARKGQDPKIGLDGSSALGPVDVTAEVAAWWPNSGEPKWQASFGVSHTWAYGEDDTLVVGAEYFHNPQGVTAAEAIDSALAAGLAGQPSPHLPLHTGRDYAGLVATVISPGNWSDSAVSLIGLSNLTDKSWTGQLNLTTRVLTDLSVELFAAVNQGSGEFVGYVPLLKEVLPRKFGAAAQPLADSLAVPMLRAGLNLRCAL